MRIHLKTLIYLVVFAGDNLAWAGSYEDFFAAIKRDDGNTITQLLQRGFDPETTDPEGRRGLILAIQEPSLKAARALIEFPKTRVEFRNVKDESPLMLAALKGQDELVAALIKRGADVNKPGWAPLHYAATNGHLSVMQTLLDENAYIDAESPNGTTPLMMAAMYGSGPAVKLLLDAGADPSLKNQQGLTAIDFARRSNRLEAVELVTAAIRKKLPRGTW